MMDDDKLAEAIQLAARCHAGQTDKCGEPYILHPLRVMLRMRDQDRQIAAVLHDVVEDCGLEVRLIAHRFGEHIGAAVDALSRREGEAYEAFIDRCCENRIARDVKFEDISDNLRPERLNKLDPDTAKRLVGKYAPALNRVFAA
jgi:hypothetical protein